MIRWLLVPTLMLSIAVPSLAASPFDGTWVGKGEAIADCGEPVVTMTVVDSKVVDGSFVGGRGVARNMTGTISPDGSATITYGTRRLEGSLKFSGNTFEGKMQSLCGVPSVKGERKQ